LNGYLQAEQCDGSSLNGKNCATVSGNTFCGGSLSCYASGTPNQCTFNTAACLTVCTGNCPSGGSSPDSYSGCRANPPVSGNYSIASGYTCLSGQQCYKCGAGYEWLASSSICNRLPGACLVGPTYYGGLCTILSYVPACITFNNVFTNTACCQGCGLGYDYACEENVREY